MEGFVALAITLALVLIGLWVIFYFIPIGLWFQAFLSNVRVPLIQLVFMRWRKVPPSLIVGALIEGKKSWLNIESK